MQNPTISIRAWTYEVQKCYTAAIKFEESPDRPGYGHNVVYKPPDSICALALSCPEYRSKNCYGRFVRLTKYKPVIFLDTDEVLYNSRLEEEDLDISEIIQMLLAKNIIKHVKGDIYKVQIK